MSTPDPARLAQIRARSRRLAAIALDVSPGDNCVVTDLVESASDVRWLLERMEQPQDDGDVRAVAERCPCGCVGGPDDCTCGLDCHCTDCLTCDPLAAVRREAPDERDGDEDHRGDEAKDCPACSAFRHQTEQVLDVRAVAALLRRIGAFFSGYAGMNNIRADADALAARFADRIAALDARDAKGGEHS